MHPFRKRNRGNTNLITQMLIILSFLLPGTILAGSWLEINVDTYPSPYLDDLLAFEGLGTIEVGNDGALPFSAELSIKLEASNSLGQIGYFLSLPFTVPGNSVHSMTASEVMNNSAESDYSTSAEASVLATGMFPEGVYTLFVSLQNISDGQQDFTEWVDFTVIGFHPPELEDPADEENVIWPQPIFTWQHRMLDLDQINLFNNPRMAAVHYMLQICEIYEMQSAQEAILINPSFWEKDFGQPAAQNFSEFYSYELMAPVMQPGQLYAWTVNLLDEDGLPLGENEGRSEIRSFRYMPEAPGGGDIDLPPMITLVDEAAWLRDFDVETGTDSQGNLLLNGEGVLQLAGIPMNAEIPVSITDLSLDSFYRPVLGDGVDVSIEGELEEHYLIPGFPWLSFENLEFDVFSGLRLLGDANLDELFPGAGSARLDMEFLAGIGYSGSLDLGSTLEWENGPLAISAEELSISLPLSGIPQIDFNSTCSIFGYDCNENIMPVLDDLGNIRLEINLADLTIPLTEGDGSPVLEIISLDGIWQTELADPENYDLSLAINSELIFPALNWESSLPICLNFENDELSFCQAPPTWDANSLPFIELPGLNLNLNEIALEQLSWDGNWDFDLNLSAGIEFPTIPGFHLPPLSLSFDLDGVTFPAFILQDDVLPDFSLAGFVLGLRGAEMASFELPWDDLLPDLDINFEMELLPPVWLSEAGWHNPIGFSTAAITANSFDFELESTDLGALNLDLGPLTTELHNLGGQISGNLSEGLSSSDLSIGLVLRVPSLTDQEIDLRNDPVFINAAGQLAGLIPALPGGDLDLGFLQMNLPGCALRLDSADTGQQLRLEANSDNANPALSLPALGGGRAILEGFFALDLLQGTLDSESNLQAENVLIPLPSIESPLVMLALESVSLSGAELIFDGQTSLVLAGDTDITLSGENFRINPLSGQIIAGRLSLNESIDLALLINESLEMRFYPQGGGELDGNGMLLALSGGLWLDQNGLGMSGEYAATFKYEDALFENLLALCSPDFQFDLSSMAVNAGSLELIIEEQTLAIIDANGFHPNLALLSTEYLPARLPLPIEELAWLGLRDADGNLAVEIDQEETGLRITGHARPLVMPIFQGDLPEAPTLLIDFMVLIDPLELSWIEGELDVLIPEEQLDVFDLQRIGLPLALQRISYGDLQNCGTTGFRLESVIQMAGSAIGESSLEISEQGTLCGNVSLDSPGYLELVPGSDAVRLNVGEAFGSFNANLLQNTIDYEINSSAGLEIKLDEDNSASVAVSLMLNPGGLRAEVSDLDFAAGFPPMDLEWMQLDLEGLQIRELAWLTDPDSGVSAWSFDLGLSLNLEIPSLDGLSIPLPGLVDFHPGGLRFRSADLAFAELVGDLPSFNMGGALFSMPTMHLPDLNLPLFDLFGGGGEESFQQAMSGDLGFRFSLRLEDLDWPDAGLPACLQNPNLAFNDLAIVDGSLNGICQAALIDDPDGCEIVIANGVSYWVTHLGGEFTAQNGQTGFRLDQRGSLVMDDIFDCPNQEITCELSINQDGLLSGSIDNLAADCGFNLGMAEVSFGGDTHSCVLQFDYPEGLQRAVLSMNGRLAIDLAGADQNLIIDPAIFSMDILSGHWLEGSLESNQPWEYLLPPGVENPLASFRIESTRIDRDGLTINGNQHLNFSADAGIAASFNNLSLALDELAIQSGEIVIQGDLGLRVSLQRQGSIGARLVAPQSALLPNEDTEFAVVMLRSHGASMTIDADGLSQTGNISASVWWDGETFDDYGITFTPDFRVCLDPIRACEGQASFHLDGDTLLVWDIDGLHPGNIFNQFELPERIGLPDEELAYIQLREGDENLIESSWDSDRSVWVISSADGGTPCYLPALGEAGEEIPRINVEFELDINPAGPSISGGRLQANSSGISGPDGVDALLDLQGLLGIPLRITELDFDARQDPAAANLSLSADLILDGLLPEGTNPGPLRLSDLGLRPGGITGEAEIGVVSQSLSQEAILLNMESLPNGLLDFGLQGLRASFGLETEIELSGQLRSSLFIDANNQPVPMHTYASLDEDGLHFIGDFSHLENATLPMGAFDFQPAQVDDFLPFELALGDAGLRLSFSGVLGLAEAEDFRLTIAGLSLGTDGVSIGSLDLDSPREFELFGTLLRITGDDGIRFTYEDGVFHALLSGEMDLWDGEHNVQFVDLDLGSDASINLASMALQGDEIELVEDFMAITGFSFDQDDRALIVEAWINPPAPFAAENPQEVEFGISLNGTMVGGADIILIDEPHAIGNGDESEFPIGDDLLTLDLTWLALRLNLAHFTQSKIVLSGDLYLPSSNQIPDRVDWGVNNFDAPAILIPFNGDDPTWGSVTVQGDWNLDLAMFELQFDRIGIDPGNSEFFFGGSATLEVPGLETSLEVNNMHIGFDGEISDWGITGGSLSVPELMSIQVHDFLWQEGGSITLLRQTGGNSASADSVTINNIEYLLRFGGYLTLGPQGSIGEGGVDEVLVYSADGQFYLAMNGATLNIGDMVEGRLSLEFTSDDQGFELGMAGGVSVPGSDMGFMLAGVIDTRSDNLHAGLFAAVEVPIPVGPVIIAGLGGGIYFNPTATDINFVRTICGIDFSHYPFEDPFARDGNSPSFAALLYAQITIIDDAMISGRALISITDEFLQMDANLILLDQDNKLEADASLVMYYRPVQLEGGIYVHVEYDPVVEGYVTGTIAVSGSNWALSSDHEFELFAGALETSGSFYIGSAGLMLSAEVSNELDIGIIEVGAGLEGSLWFLPDEDKLGAYMRGWLEASVACGAVTAGASVEVALIIRPSFLLYGAAHIEVEVLWVIDLDADAWIAVTSDDLDWGWGSKSAYADMVSESRDMEEQMQEEMAEALTPPTLDELFPISTDELADAGRQMMLFGMSHDMDDLDQAVRGNALWIQIGEEIIPGEFANPNGAIMFVLRNVAVGDSVHYPLMQRSINQQLEAEEMINTIIEQQNDLNAAFSSLGELCPELSEGANYIEKGTPVTDANGGTLENSEIRLISAIDIADRIPSGFAVDRVKADNMVDDLNTFKEDAREWAQEVAAVIQIEQENASTILSTLQGDLVDDMAANWADAMSVFTASHAADLHRLTRASVWSRRMREDMISDIRHDLFDEITNQAGQLAGTANGNIYQTQLWRLTQFRRQMVFNMIDRSADGTAYIEAMRDSVSNMSSANQKSWLRQRCIDAGIDLHYTPYINALQEIGEECEVQADIMEGRHNSTEDEFFGQYTGFSNQIALGYEALHHNWQTIFDLSSEFLYEWTTAYADSAGYSLYQLGLIRNQAMNKLSGPSIHNIRKDLERTEFECNLGYSWHGMGSSERAFIRFDNHSGAYLPGTYDDFIYYLGSRNWWNLTWGSRSVSQYINSNPWNPVPNPMNWVDVEVIAVNDGGTTSTFAAPNFQFGCMGYNGGFEHDFVVQPVDTTPPSPPVIILPEYFNGIGGLPVTLHSSDMESDIHTFLVKVIKTNGEILRDWEEVGSQENVLIFGLDLEQGDAIRVRAKAMNNHYRISNYRSSQHCIIDVTPPNQPEVLGEIEQDLYYYSGWGEDPLAKYLPSISLTVTEGDDAQSGRNIFAITTSTTPQCPQFNYPGEGSEWSSRGAEVTHWFDVSAYNETSYIHIVAVNNARTPSMPLTIGPLEYSDPTAPPNAPTFSANPHPIFSRPVNVSIETPSTDPESGIAGYQYKISKRIYVALPMGGYWAETAVRNFPLNGIIDVNADDAGMAFLAIQNYMSPAQYKVRLRAVNGNGLTGPTSSPVQFRIPGDPTLGPVELDVNTSIIIPQRRGMPVIIGGSLGIDLGNSNGNGSLIIRGEISVFKVGLYGQILSTELEDYVFFSGGNFPGELAITRDMLGGAAVTGRYRVDIEIRTLVGRSTTVSVTND
jgi:large repetitive protein